MPYVRLKGHFEVGKTFAEAILSEDDRHKVPVNDVTVLSDRMLRIGGNDHRPLISRYESNGSAAYR